MFSWYDLLGQPLTSMKIPLLSVPIAVDKVTGQGQVSAFSKKIKKVPFQQLYHINIGLDVRIVTHSQIGNK